MPTYTFLNKNTGNEWTEIMSISSRTEFLEKNPHVEQLVNGAPAVVSGINTFGHKRTVDTDFRSKLKAIKKANPGSGMFVP